MKIAAAARCAVLYAGTGMHAGQMLFPHKNIYRAFKGNGECQKKKKIIPNYRQKRTLNLLRKRKNRKALFQ
ncbi:MAG: hypothetical protein IKF59_12620 [Lachnospiraceae bacterium]|nr:hypothetical protein [Lachnospiraceae bacterium]